MRILLKEQPTNALNNLVQGWINLFLSRGHQTAVWNGRKPFDTFLSFKPDMYIGESSDELDACISNYISINPSFQLIEKQFDYAADVIKYYPVKQEFGGLTYIGSYDNKIDLIEQYIVPLCVEKHPIKIFGHGNWLLPNYLGMCSDNTERIIYSNTISLNLSHNKNEKMFKVFACGGFCLSNNNELVEIFDKDLFFNTYEEMLDKIRFFTINTSKRNKLSQRMYQHVKSNHTYFHKWKKEIDASLL